MKKIFLFAFLINAFQASFAHVNSKNDILLRIQVLQDEVKNAIADLKLFEISEFNKIYQYFQEQDLNLTRAFRKIQETTNSEIEIVYTKLNAKDANSESCYKTAQLNQSEVYQNATEEFETCEYNSFFLNFSPIMTQVNFTLQVSENLLKRFDIIQENLILANKISSLETVYLKSTLSGIEILANSVKNLIKDEKNLALELSQKAVVNMTNCASYLKKSLFEEYEKIKENFKHCISKNTVSI